MLCGILWEAREGTGFRIRRPQEAQGQIRRCVPGGGESTEEDGDGVRPQQSKGAGCISAADLGDEQREGNGYVILSTTVSANITVQNTYLIGINVANKMKEKYYHEYVPEVLDVRRFLRLPLASALTASPRACKISTRQESRS